MNHGDKLREILNQAVQRHASDLHLVVGRYPTLRVDGSLVALEGQEVLKREMAEGLIKELLNEEQRNALYRDRQIDLAYSLADNTRFRVNAYFQQGYWSAALRLVPAKIRNIDELGLPPVLHNFSKLSQGFILIVGSAGHGKSTTAAALIDEINRNRAAHIVTIEDPIEYLFSQEKGVVSQREVGSDTHSFAAGLSTVLRQDPDVIMVGEMRDADSISAAMTAAETGHLVLSTLHTNSASQTIDRIIDSFPSTQQQQIATQLATTLVAILSIRLVPKIKGGRIPALELMMMNAATRNIIRERKIYAIDNVIETSLKEGMMTLDHSLATLVKAKEISLENAELYASSPASLNNLL